TKGLWIAWGRGSSDFAVVNRENKVKVPDEDGYTLKRINLRKNEVEGFYYGFANEIMWPICHNLVTKARFVPEYWQKYRQVNKKYARAALDEMKNDDLIWIHDYHLTLVPGMIKEENPEAKIAFFWHIPWPPREAFTTIPWQKEILSKMMTADFLGFHTSQHVHNFMESAREIGAEVDFNRNLIKYNGHTSKALPVPLGIDYDSFKIGNDPEIKSKARKLKENFHADRLIFGVDRLDYTKGILERLQAVDLLFSEHPQYRGSVTLVQRISPSRTRVQEYKNMRQEINQKVGDINGKYQQEDWVPIRYFRQSVPQEELLPYYRAADLALITPLVDGMNLVAKEYIAAQNDGVLILSKFAGAAEELQEAELVNPYHIHEVAETIHHSLQREKEARNQTMSKLKQKVKKHDLDWWRDKFMEEWMSLYDRIST
ncbi:MAG: alpha,alpha-trehalose-phosphate synthase (UDP-forming), partial [Halanaerobiaceae bacterium]